MSAATLAPPAARVESDRHEITVREVRTDAEFRGVVTLRREVFGVEQQIADSGFTDGDDARSIQALALIAGHPVGAGRLTPNKGEQGEAVITWVATRAEYRGRGIGRAVMELLLRAADRGGVGVIVLSAQTHALAFYRRLGFVEYDRRFVVRGIEHQMMARRRGRWSGNGSN